MKRFVKPSGALLAMVFTLGISAASAHAQSRLLFYQAGTGVGATAEIDPQGNFRTCFSYDSFSPDWTHVINAGENDELLFYNANNGHGATGFIADDCEFIGQMNYDNFSTGWTHVVGAGGGRVLFYDQATGDAVTGYIDPAGNYTDLHSYDNFSPGWTHIAFTGLTGYLLFYNADTGAGDGIYRQQRHLHDSQILRQLQHGLDPSLQCRRAARALL
jgi:hypothetical protein